MDAEMARAVGGLAEEFANQHRLTIDVSNGTDTLVTYHYDPADFQDESTAQGGTGTA
jgi:hypothetical protein